MGPTTAVADAFPRPPRSFADDEGREIDLRVAESPDGLAAMYEAFGPEDRAQGLPPRGEDRVADWLDGLFADGLNVVAEHDGRAVGHAVLMPFDGAAELVIFVRPDYQEAGVGSRLIRALLGHGQAEGIDHVWLCVERSNRVARHLYRSVGFEIEDDHAIEFEMSRDL